MSEAIWLALINLVGGAISGAITAWIITGAKKKKHDAEASKKITDAAATAVEKLLGPLNKRIDELEGELRRMKAGVERLIRQIRCLGHEPVWTPEMDEPVKNNGRKG